MIEKKTSKQLLFLCLTAIAYTQVLSGMDGLGTPDSSPAGVEDLRLRAEAAKRVGRDTTRATVKKPVTPATPAQEDLETLAANVKRAILGKKRIAVSDVPERLSVAAREALVKELNENEKFRDTIGSDNPEKSRLATVTLAANSPARKVFEELCTPLLNQELFNKLDKKVSEEVSPSHRRGLSDDLHEFGNGKVQRRLEFGIADASTRKNELPYDTRRAQEIRIKELENTVNDLKASQFSLKNITRNQVLIGCAAALALTAVVILGIMKSRSTTPAKPVRA